MTGFLTRAFLVLLASAAVLRLPMADSPDLLRMERTSPGDLEVGGDLPGLPAGSTRYLRYEDLLRLPQQTYTVTDDANLPPGARISGVPMEALAAMLGESASDTFIVAICDDQYRANYPHDYLAAHHPLLVLRINGKPHDQWPALSEGGSGAPYLISHPFFKPSFRVLSHEDEPQLPYGIVRLEFRRESAVYGAIRPPGNPVPNSPVAQGFVIARQDCFRCHNSGSQGGAKAGRSWQQLALSARLNPQRFRQIIRNPTSVDPKATMPAHADYDDLTLGALTAYFKALAPVGSRR